MILDGTGDEKIESDGTDISFSVGTDGDINIPADIGLTFGNDGEKIEGDGSNLTVNSGRSILLVTSNVVVPSLVPIEFGSSLVQMQKINAVEGLFNAKLSISTTGNVIVTHQVMFIFRSTVISYYHTKLLQQHQLHNIA